MQCQQNIHPPHTHSYALCETVIVNATVIALRVEWILHLCMWMIYKKTPEALKK